MSADMLRVEGLTVELPASGQRRNAVEDVSFALRQGETLCMVGESGSGKSVIAHAIMGLLPSNLRASAGRIMLGEQDIRGLPEARLKSIRSREISMIFQEPMTALNPLMRVGDQIAEVMRVHGWRARGDIEARLHELAEQVRLPDPALTLRAYPLQLSGGQRQRVMIAMALALKPKVLIADEPTTALDVTTQAQILAVIKELQRAYAMGVLFVTHDFGVVADIADRVIVMEKGVAVEHGEATDILLRPTHPYTRRLIASVPTLRPPMAQRALSDTAALAIRGLTKRYVRRSGLFGRRSVVPAVSDVDLVVKRGEIFGIIGESGSGKSTLGRCIVHLAEPDGGEILIGGIDMSGLRGRARRMFRSRVQMVFQDPFGSLNPRQTIGAIIGNVARLAGADQAEAARRAGELLRLVGLDARATERYPHEFSGGQRQRISLARALATKPELLIADEAVSALDVSIQAQILDLLRELRERLGLSILFITHDLRVAAQLCDRVAVMLAGRIVEEGRPTEMFAAPRHAYTARLLASIPGQRMAAFTDEPINIDQMRKETCP